MLKRLRRAVVRPGIAAPQELSGRRIVVTGAGPGSIGYETAKQLARWGAHVIVTRRSGAVELAAELARCGDVCGHDLSLDDAGSVAAFVTWCAQRGDSLDVLINNAGVHLDLMSEWKAPKLSADGHEIQWRTNHLGPFQLTLGLLPLLRRAASRTGDARVVNVVSQLHSNCQNEDLFTARVPYNSWVAYGASKLAQVHVAFEIERRFGAEGLHGYCLHPGSVYTNVAARGLEGKALIGQVRRWLAPAERFALMTPEEGAQTSVYCATAPRLTGGRYFTRCAPAEVSAQARVAGVGARLWDETHAWLQTLGVST